jgi:hypothetical protein
MGVATRCLAVNAGFFNIRPIRVSGSRDKDQAIALCR